MDRARADWSPPFYQRQTHQRHSDRLVDSIIGVNKSHRRTLSEVFSSPTPRSLEWRRIESLILALGAQAVEGRGSRVRFELNGVIASFHRPHPQKEDKPYQVRDARAFLSQAGVKP